jgi:hypothetical protein
MAFILSAQRDKGSFEELRANWERYRDHLKAAEGWFPPSAFRLATSDWWYAFDRAEAPHDSRLLALRVRDIGAESYEGNSPSAIEVTLHSAYGGIIHLRYPTVYRYSLEMPAGVDGVHDDWRYDEFHATESGRVVHTIEWARGTVWQIEASELFHDYVPPSKSA